MVIRKRRSPVDGSVETKVIQETRVIQEIQPQTKPVDLQAEMAKSLMCQSGVTNLEVGVKYLHCMTHGFVNAMDENSNRPVCSICGSKMIWKKFF